MVKCPSGALVLCLLLGGCSSVRQRVTLDRVGAGIVWAGLILLLVWGILRVIRWLHGKGAPWQVAYLGANVTAAMGAGLIVAILGATLLPLDVLYVTAAGATVAIAWFAASLGNLPRNPYGRQGRSPFWWWLRPNPWPSQHASHDKRNEPIAAVAPADAPAATQASAASPTSLLAPAPAAAPPPAQTLATLSASYAAGSRVGTVEPPPAGAVPRMGASHCPHGQRRREFCPICDPDGYRLNFGDWRTD